MGNSCSCRGSSFCKGTAIPGSKGKTTTSGPAVTAVQIAWKIPVLQLEEWSGCLRIQRNT